ncbi:transglycosylase family protein [Mycolicibacterium vanbaalenii]|uniref:transglycosylase family protein n=1 Tax=Mycolicibacterium vanbaalenii TaxID=110539 RepID=UPI0024110535|nr:transglycosylase family protein [Mycolicibacterium vanbaalenii]WND57018.1 transglycosylase family protein [Mycolicibacterium vanbaalenii]
MTIELDVVTRLNERSALTAARQAHSYWDRESRTTGDTVQRNLGAGFDRAQKAAERSAVQMQRSFNRVADSTGRVRLEQERYDALIRSGDADRVKLIQQAERLATARRNEATLVRQAAAAHRDYSTSLNSLGGDFDRASAQSRTLTENISNLGSTFTGLGRAAGPVGMAALVPALGMLAGVAAQATGALGLLPGVLGSVAAGFGTAKLGLLGFGEALESVSDPEKFAEALRTLSPNAQQAALSIRAMMPALTQLKNATQDALFANMGPQLTTTLNTVLPQVQRLTTGVASGLNQMFSGVMGQLASPEGLATLRSITDSIVASFRNLAPAAAPFTQAIMQLVDVGASFMPQLASALTEGAKAFAAFIDEASRSGQLQEFIQGGINAMRELGPIVADTTKTFLALAPVGERVLPLIGDTIHGISVVMGPLAKLTAEFSPLFKSWELAILAVGTAFKVIEPVANVALGIVDKLGERLNYVLAPINALIDAADALGIIDADMGSGSGGGWGSSSMLSPTQQGSLFGNGGMNAAPGIFGTGGMNAPPAGPTAGLPTTAGLFPGADAGTGWWHPSAVGNPNQLQQEYEARMDALDEAGRPGAKTPEGLTPNAAQLQQVLQQMFPGLQVNADVGRQDRFGEHSSGEALDIMVGNNRVLGEQLNRWLLQNAESFGLQYNLWRQAQWDPSGEIRPMPDRGDPTQNHMDHIHARVRPGEAASGNYMPLGAHPYQSGVQGVTVESFGSSAQSDLNGLGGQLGAQLDQDFGISKGLPGLAENAVKFVGNLFFAPLLTALQALAGGRPGEGSGLIGMAAAANGYGGGARGGAMGPSPMFPTPSAMGPAGLQPPWSADWNAIAQGESGGNWGINTGNGYSGGLQFSPSSWEAAGGTQFAPSAHQATPYQQALTAEELLRMQGPGAWPNTFVPGSSGPAAPGAPGGPGILGLPFGGGGSMLPGTGMPQAAPLTTGGMAYPTAGGGGFQGLGGLPMDAAMMATSGLDALAPGAGAAAKIGIQLANRTVAYLGQVAGIGVSGLMETLSLGDNPMGSLGKSWFGRLAGGFAGARPATGNLAGQAAPATPAGKDPRAAAQQGLQAAKSGDTNITVNNNRPTEDGTGRDIAWHVYSPAGRQG